MNSNPLPSGNLSHSNNHIMDTNDKSVRLYQVWRGNNTFVLGGRLIFGPDVKSIFLTLFLILAPVFLFCAFVSKELIDALPHHSGVIILVICVIWTTYVVMLLLITAGKDPGIHPRNPHPPDLDDYDASSISTDWACSHSANSSLPTTKIVMVNHKVMKVKFCRTCMFYRPPRCSHCSICNNCIERFDHHCPWLGQCIGRRNYRYFFMFVSSTTLLCLYVFAVCWVNIVAISKTFHCSLWRASVLSPISAVLIAYTFLVSWFVGGLTTFHLYLICMNQTTYENFRYLHDRKSNPYNIGCLQNIWETLFSTIPKSKHNFRAHVIPFSPSISYHSSNLQHTMISDNQNTSFDLEKENQQGVDSDDIEDIRIDIDSDRLKRCGTQSRSWNSSKELGSSNLPTDVHISPTESEHKAHDT